MYYPYEFSTPTLVLQRSFVVQLCSILFLRRDTLSFPPIPLIFWEPHVAKGGMHIVAGHIYIKGWTYNTTIRDKHSKSHPKVYLNW